MAAELQAALERAGLRAVPAADGALTVEGADTDRVGELAFAAGVPLHELTAQATSLEEAFLALTSGEATP
jgi:ABC-2 type transport system ATP-binding protein